MSIRRFHHRQPERFAFTDENRQWAGRQIAKYPSGRQASAIVPLLWRAQQQAGGWLPEPAVRHVADMLEVPYIRACEVATFYTMFNLKPVGRLVQVCGTTPCWLRGADALKNLCHRRFGPPGQSGAAGSWMEVECLGACVNAPVVQIGDDYYEDLDVARLEVILDALDVGRPLPPGPQSGRHSSEPHGFKATGDAPRDSGNAA